MRTRRTKVATAVAAAVATIAVAVPASLIALPSSPETQADPPVTAVEPATSDLLAIFERPRAAADAVPQPPEGADPIELSDRRPGEAYDLSRRAAPGPDGAPAVYMWPKDTGVCFSTEGVGSCADAADIDQRGVIVTYSGGQSVPNGGIRVMGIARDGIREVEIALANGKTTTAPVIDNALLIDLASEPRQLRWVMPNGAERVEKAPAFNLAARQPPQPAQ